MNDRNNLKHRILGRQWFILLLIILLISVFTALKNSRFPMSNNVMDIFEQIAVLDLVAVGVAILIISGSFDMSAGVVIELSSCLMTMMTNTGIPTPAAAAAGILTATFYTFFNGVLIILFKTPSFIISLATTSVYTGTALYLIEGVIQTVCEEFDTMSRFCLFGVIPLIPIVGLMGYVVVGTILRHTQIGQRIFVIGPNEKAALLLGIRVTRNKLIFFALNGFFMGLTAVLLLSRVGSALPSTGAGYGLQAIGTAVIDGIPTNGGKGNIVGTFFGVLPMGFISDVLNMLGVSSHLQETASGALIIISLGISAIRTHILTKNQEGS